jgi:cyclopropane-fatty-acyl-phospholipid synthase
MLATRLFERVVKSGVLTVIDARGRRHEFRGAQPGPTVVIRLHDRKLHWRLFVSPALAVGEAYMDGALTVEDGGEIYDFVDFCARNLGRDTPDFAMKRLLKRLRLALRGLRQYNPAPRARRNAAHHYDLTDELYELFLDADRQYSCAYFQSPDDSLELAQERKKAHIAAKLLLKPGQKVLDIGSGWGGLGLFLARRHEVEVVGVTLAERQQAVSTERARREMLDGRVQFRLQDYRAVAERFDRIVSVGMFEHVGVLHYDEFFAKVRDLLTDDGVMLLHTIGRADGPGWTNPWIDKYIFPGGYSPALSDVLPAIERSGLWVTDIEVLRLHYAETLRHWRARFKQNRDKVAALYDERFCRMWELYLAGSEVAFRHSGHVVFQIQLAKRQDAVPLVRDYITDYERGYHQNRLQATRRAG